LIKVNLKTWWQLITFLSVIIGIIVGGIEIYSKTIGNKVPDVSGSWKYNFITEQTSYRAFKGLKATWKMYITQDGNKVSGTGEAIAQNDIVLPTRKRITMNLIGTIKDDILTVTFNVVNPSSRNSSGSFTMYLGEKVGGYYKGKFNGTAANSTGQVIAYKE
jgi:hypothetical protein